MKTVFSILLVSIIIFFCLDFLTADYKAVCDGANLRGFPFRYSIYYISYDAENIAKEINDFKEFYLLLDILFSFVIGIISYLLLKKIYKRIKTNA